MLFSVTPAMAQPVDYCEGNFDNDNDQDGTDAFVFKQDFGRSSLLDPCPVIQCQTAEQLEMRIAQLEALLANVTRSTVQGQDTIRFSGMNVQIVNGIGATNGPVNGRGNLIVGYNELRGSGDDRTGSHNIVVGSFNNYLSYGGLVAGSENTISGQYASVIGGVYNTASGNYAVVSGGESNTSSGGAASVSGGGHNTASADVASISGGEYNTASNYYSSVSGGSYNTAANLYSSVSGGYYNGAVGRYASVSGGRYNDASGWYSSVSGGSHNQAMGEYSFVGGGGSENPVYGNYAFGNYSAILGGSYNTAGDPNHTDTTIGPGSSVCGGQRNTASGSYASVGGGFINTASGGWSSVSGGNSRSATGLDDWAAGALFQEN